VTALRRHVAAVVAALLAMAVGIALGGGPLSYVPERDDAATDRSTTPPAPTGSGSGSGELLDLAETLVDATAAELYAGRMLDNPTAILVMPVVAPVVVEDMVGEVGRAGGGLTGVFTLDAQATDLGSSSLVDTLGSQLMTQLDDPRVDPEAPTYLRLGQLLGLAVGTPAKGGLRADESAETVRQALATAGLLTSEPGARLAARLIVLLPDSADRDEETRLAELSIYTALLLGVADNVAGVVVLGDSASAAGGLLADLREDPVLTGTVSTVGGSESEVGRVVGMLALIAGLQGSPGSYGASGSDGLPSVP
jgi:hypothetical protein